MHNQTHILHPFHNVAINLRLILVLQIWT
jgi:hypothetical protein